jgi:hypothetical protein
MKTSQEGPDMNINNFESYINKTIFDRGYNYYLEGHVVEFYQQGENEYFFHIEGSYDYEVVNSYRVDCASPPQRMTLYYRKITVP